MIDPDITAILDRVPGFRGRAHVVGNLSGGITNRNVLVDVEGERFVVRIAGTDTHLLGIDRDVERAANERAAALGPATVQRVARDLKRSEAVLLTA